KGNWIEDHAIADDRPAAFAQHPAGHQLQDELLAVNNDGVPGVVASRIAGHDGEALREHVYDLAFAFIAPLGAHDDRGFAFLQSLLLVRISLEHLKSACGGGPQNARPRVRTRSSPAQLEAMKKR